MKKTTLYILLGAFIALSFHTYMHNPFDHAHDNECSVYVLEKMTAGADVVAAIEILLLFLGFVFFQFTIPKRQVRFQKLFSIRAPPRS